MILISPRNPKSNWSGVNKGRVSYLFEQERMEAPGIKSVEISKSNGTWDFLNEVDNLIVPEDLQIALEENKKAGYYFDRFPNSSKRGILEWIKNAKRLKTRKKRISETVAKASKKFKSQSSNGQRCRTKR